VQVDTVLAATVLAGMGQPEPRAAQR